MVENHQKSKKEIAEEDKLIVLLGPTASGKTGKAVELARNLGAEIISADSRQVYRGMDLGTGKDLEEYKEVPYHLIDICNAGEKYNLYRFLRDFHEAYSGIRSRGRRVILCGGTGMYLEAALSGLRLPEVPENKALRSRLTEKSLDELTEILKSYKTLHNSTDIDTPKRAIRAIEIEEFYINNPELSEASDRNKSKPINSLIIGLDIPRDERRKRITRRLHARLDSGMVEEVENLLKSGLSPDDLIYYGLEYKYLTLYAIGEYSYSQMVKELEIAIHQFSKRQMTWFRGMQRRGFNIHWLPYDMPSELFCEQVRELLSEEK